MITTIKKFALGSFVKFLEHKDVRESLNRHINQLTIKPSGIVNQSAPYYQYTGSGSTQASQRSDIVFVTSRFRSGSTLLWNVFRNIDKTTSYYEPFNERRWFDKEARGQFVDNTHLGVSDYWAEYDGLEVLGESYNENWIRDHLFMDKFSHDPGMKCYIDHLVNAADGRPVLQFNRIDFRLAWLKHHYPNAKIVHLYREPRDQWLSFLTDKLKMSSDRVANTYVDAFYLDTWCHNLKSIFPFLSPKESQHPYQRFYYLWKLSYLFGQRDSDISIGFEALCTNPEQQLGKMFDVLDWQCVDIKKASSVIERVPFGKWKDYAEESWFSDIEADCEQNLDRFLGRS